MEIKVKKNLAAPLMTLLKLHDATYASGVCGVLTKGSRNIVEGVTLSSAALLSYLIEFDLGDSLTDSLGVFTLNLPEGKLTYASLEEASQGALLAPEKPEREIAMITSPLVLEVIYSRSTYANPVTEEQILTIAGNPQGKVLTLAELPLLPRVVRFNEEYEGDYVTLSSDELGGDALTLLFEDLMKN